MRKKLRDEMFCFCLVHMQCSLLRPFWVASFIKGRFKQAWFVITILVWLVWETFTDLICSYWWWQLHWWPPRGGMSLHPGGMSWCLRSNVLGGWESEIWYKREEMESWKHTIGMREWIRCRKTILSGRMLWIFSQEEMGTMQPGSLLVWHQKDYSAVDNRFGH